MSKINILFPSDFFDKHKVDAEYESEYIEVCKFNNLIPILFNYDNFINGEKLKIVFYGDIGGLCIYRGWMLKSEKYTELYNELLSQNIKLINTPNEYETCHEFPNVYEKLKKLTPKIEVFEDRKTIDWNIVKSELKKFMMKDYVKSVKGSNFPVFFDDFYTDEQLNNYVETFKDLRGTLYVKGIVLKQFVNLDIINNTTNEYRGFYLNGKLILLSANSNQSDKSEKVSIEFLNQVPNLDSSFYTVDFAQLKNKSWVIIETGDGQVSALPPSQYIFGFYETISEYYFSI